MASPIRSAEFPDDYSPVKQAPRQNGSNDIVVGVEAELEQKLAEASESKQADLDELRWNLLREQISNISREFSAMRQDINTLRLADSQYEVQNAETARHVREMQAQVTADVQAEAVRSEELSTQLQANVDAAMSEAKQATRGIAELQEGIVSKVNEVDDRVSSLLATCEEHFLTIRSVQTQQEEDTMRSDKANLQLADLASDVRGAKRDFDNHTTNVQSSIRQAVAHLADEIAQEMQSLKEKDMELKLGTQYLEERTKANLTSVQEPMKDEIEQMQREFTAKITDVKEAISRTAGQDRASREELISNSQVEMHELQARCRQDCAEKLADSKTAADRNFANIQELMGQERAAREKATGGNADRMSDIDHRLKDIAHELAEFRTKSASGTMLDSLDRKMANELTRLGDEISLKHDQLKATVGSFSSNLENIDRKVDRRDKGKPAAPEANASGPVEGLLSTLERKLRDDMNNQVSEVRQRIQELKDTHMRTVHEHSTKHTEMSEAVSRVTTQEKAAREDSKGQLGQQLDALEQKLRRDIVAMGAGFEACNQNLAQETRNRERTQSQVYEKVEEVDRRTRDASASEFRKLREDLIAEHAGRQAELKENLMRVSIEMNNTLNEQKNSVVKLIAQEKSSREELRGALVLGTDALGTKMRRELEESRASAERSANTLRDQFTKERADREGACNSIASSISAVERRCREEMFARVDEQRSLFHELKDDVAKALAAELSARDELRMGVAASMEGFEVRLRREMADDGIIRDYVTQERLLREKGVNAVSERLSDVERKVMADLAQLSIKREVAITELKDLVTDICSRDRARLQEMLIKEAEGRSLLQEAVGKQLSQERAAREVQQETLRVYLAQDRGQRDAPIQGIRERMDAIERQRAVEQKENVVRAEFDRSMRRVWEVVDSHSYYLTYKKPEQFAVEVPNQSPMQTVQRTMPSTLPASMQNPMTTLYMPPSGPAVSKVSERVVDIPSASQTQGDIYNSGARQVTFSPQLQGRALRPPGNVSPWMSGFMQNAPQSISAQPGLIVETVRPLREENGMITTLPLLSQAAGASERTSSPSPGLAVTFSDTTDQIIDRAMAGGKPYPGAEDMAMGSSPFRTEQFRTLSPMRGQMATDGSILETMSYQPENADFGFMSGPAGMP